MKARSKTDMDLLAPLDDASTQQVSLIIVGMKGGELVSIRAGIQTVPKTSKTGDKFDYSKA